MSFCSQLQIHAWNLFFGKLLFSTSFILLEMVCTENMFREHVPAGTVPRTSVNARPVTDPRVLAFFGKLDDPVTDPRVLAFFGKLDDPVTDRSHGNWVTQLHGTRHPRSYINICYDHYGAFGKSLF